MIEERLSKLSDEIWDRFFDFIYDNDKELSGEEVKAELTRFGIDITQGFQRIKDALKGNEGVCERRDGSKDTSVNGGTECRSDDRNSDGESGRD